MEIARREFLKSTAAFSLGCMMGMTAFSGEALAAPSKTRMPLLQKGAREAMFYESLEGGIAHCLLCPCSPLDENCGFLKEGELCVCNVRYSSGGKLYVTNYGKLSALHIDSIEKNPIYHMTPGRNNLAVATAGCNLDCQCCQNWEMSQKRVDQVKCFSMTPREVVKKAKENKCHGISYTYTEPVIFYEYMLDTAKLAQQSGLKNCMVTGGYILSEPLKLLTKHIDGFSVSVKGFTEDFYKKYCRGRLGTVLNALKILKEKGSWCEIVVLVIPTLSDNMDQIDWFCQWVKDNLGVTVPLHFSRFYPSYRMSSLPKTPVTTLEKAYKIARGKGLQYVYLGNLPGHEGGNTFCHKCRTLLIQRIGMKLIKSNIRGGKCPSCGAIIPGIWS
ncbi:MAG: AmmeMemoRadiSam system radical SAM enzyme [Candidatus Eremiobacteraeota bacterium]|nr:AmmeMemoRadiSam system radical SAM enzyme [Candidatus Eremiobacteraeota bacterium]